MPRAACKAIKRQFFPPVDVIGRTYGLRLVVMLHSLAWFQGRDKKVFRTFYFAPAEWPQPDRRVSGRLRSSSPRKYSPYAVLAVQLRHTLLLTVVAAIFVITMRQRNGSRTDELCSGQTAGTRRSTFTVDATGELVILRHLRRVWMLVP